MGDIITSEGTTQAAIEFFGAVATGAGHHFVQTERIRPPAAEWPPDTRIFIGVLIDPAQPQHLAPFHLLELPTAEGWRTELWQPAEIQRGRVLEETGGVEDEDDQYFLPCPSKLLGFENLRPLPPELPQPFRLDR